ncbi:Co2+/Mg2+ efflux protein ApaG [Deinococcus aquiradiocola]|uniref:Protein ApaG n=1 Tax=Deinococcus aquiradiocola TaxID=393059 RepID=A0A917P4A1_9DEIO|nr:Co2+/Mg2+ efflux protein ApaG [Deinococcus aquiradiocola]GGJ60979.1 protein ApaG [Deinococcus aquiradiocola]
MSDQPDLSVAVDVRYRPDHSRDGRWLFQYVITIENRADESWQVLAREWTITDGEGRVTQVAGEGVVGQTPVLAPGGVYVYDSFVTLQVAPGRMEGRYRVRNAWGHEAWAPIPPFVLALPDGVPGGDSGQGRVLN